MMLGVFYKKIGLEEYNSQEWQLFIGSSVESLKCTLLHNGNRYASIPIGHSISMKEEYDSIKLILEKLVYLEHQREISVDLKMVNFLMLQQSVYTKYLSFFSMWSSRLKSEHWTRKDWPLRKEMIVGEKNIIHQPLAATKRLSSLNYIYKTWSYEAIRQSME